MVFTDRVDVWDTKPGKMILDRLPKPVFSYKTSLVPDHVDGNYDFDIPELKKPRKKKFFGGFGFGFNDMLDDYDSDCDPVAKLKWYKVDF